MGVLFFGDDFLGEIFCFGVVFLADFEVGLGILVSSDDSVLLDFEILAGAGLLGDSLFRFDVFFLGEGFLGETLLFGAFFFTGDWTSTCQIGT